MNPGERALRRVDATQQHFPPAAFVFGLVKKYGDDNGGVLASNLAYSAFVSLFPLLLVLVTVLGLAASVDAGFRQEILDAVAAQVPLIGHQLTGNVHALRRSSIIGLVIGLAGLVWGTTGLAQSGLFAMEQVWNVPGPARPGYVQRLGRALAFLGLLGVGVAVTTGLAALSTYGQKAVIYVILAEVAAAVTNAGMFLAVYRALTPKGVPAGKLLPGAATAGVAWTLLQILGTYLVHHYLSNDSIYGVFGTVLGLMAWIYLAVQILIYAAEINVVVARRLWPRSILQPPLTEADRASMAVQALQNQRRPEEHVEVSFDDRKPGAAAADTTPETPEDIAPPAPEPSARQGKPAS
jgi:YihY family inner membrane protein